MPLHLPTIDSDAYRALSDEERAFVDAELRAAERVLEENPLGAYHPHARQHAFHAIRSKQVIVRIFAGGNRSGKTVAGCNDDIIQALDREALPPHLRQYKKWEPPFRCRIMVPDLTDTLEGVMFETLQEWLPRGELQGGSWARAYSKSTRMLRFKNGSFFQFLSFEMESFKMGGAKLHRVHFDEEPPYSVYRENFMRLTDFPGAELVFTFTPLFGMTWLYDELYLPAVKHELDWVRVIHVDMDDNPHGDARQKQFALHGTSEEERAARKSGRFVSFAGLIYGKHFSETRHVIPEWSHAPENANYHVWIDPGQHYMTAVGWYAIDDHGAIVKFDERSFTEGEDVERVCAEIQRVNAYWRIDKVRYGIDPSAQNRSLETGRSLQQAYADRGIVCMLGQNDVRAGIAELRYRLRPIVFDQATLEQVDGTPLYHVTANCTETIREFGRYRWKKPVNLRDPEESDARTRPHARDDHHMDIDRYCCMSRPLKPRLYHEDSRTRLERMMVDDQAQAAKASGRARKVHHTPEGNIYA